MAKQRLGVRIQGNGYFHQAHRIRHLSTRLRQLGETGCGSGRRETYALTLNIQPPFELGRIGHGEARQKIAAVECERIVATIVAHRLVERTRVAPEAAGVQPNFLIAATDHHLGAQRLAQEVECSPERRTRTRFIVLRPEGFAEEAPPAEAADMQRQVGQERQSLWLGEDGLQRSAVGPGELDGAEQVKADETGPRFGVELSHLLTDP